jgi:FSR family fosmidomycin resistance protein-like MFS transporter
VTGSALLLLLIEFLDEFVFGAREAAWPLIRSDLGLSYTQVGLLLSLPTLIGNLVELPLGILGDTWKRRELILGGGALFALALLITALSPGFPLLLIAFILLSPASGAFVGLSQATLMDSDPGRHEQNMARWTFAGSVGATTGPLLLGAAVALGTGWRGAFLVFFALASIVWIATWRAPRAGRRRTTSGGSFGQGVRDALRALRRGAVLRWLVLLVFSDLVLDVLLGFLALYFVDVAGATHVEAALAVTLWTGTSLLGGLLLIPLLERLEGLRYLSASAAAELGLLAVMLLAPSLWAKVALLGLLGLLSAGWYSILKAQLYSSMPGQSGTVMTVGNMFGMVGGLIPLGLGLVAERIGLRVAMWLLLLGPVALLAGLPRHTRGSPHPAG